MAAGGSPSMESLQSVPDIGDGPADNDAHRVVHVGLLHLVFDIDRDILFVKLLHEIQILLKKGPAPLIYAFCVIEKRGFASGALEIWGQISNLSPCIMPPQRSALMEN